MNLSKTYGSCSITPTRSIQYVLNVLNWTFCNRNFQVDSQVYSDAKALEKFFDEQLEKFLPDYSFSENDEDGQPPKKYRRIITDWQIVQGANNTVYFSLWTYSNSVLQTTTMKLMKHVCNLLRRIGLINCMDCIYL